jgi:predicted Ser/Thr protein kinase
MTSARWDRLKVIFHGALAQPAHERRAWLERACEGDRALLQEAETLLQSLDSAGGFLEEPATLDSTDAEMLPPGTELGPYRLVEEIGRGGMGVVYLAEDSRLGRRVAVKALPSDVAANDELRQRLRREARAAATISHPAVATIYALEEIDEHLIIVSEYVEGETLREIISRGPLDPAHARTIATQVAHALRAAHDAGIVHRDLKPENVLVTPSGDVKVVDFGIAHIEGSDATRLTRAGALLGTPAYMAPEQLLGRTVDPRADIYAFGVLLSEMVTGRHPLHPGPAATTAHAFTAIVTRCMQAEAAARYGSVRELLEALEDPNAPYVVSGFSRAPSDVASGSSRTSPRWWWEFHQAMAALVYWLMTIPAWRARDLIGGVPGRVFFIVVLVSVIVAANLRLHLWFTSRFYPGQLRWARRRVGRWIRAADWVFVTVLAVGGLVIGEERSPIAVILISVAIGTAIVFLVIERATTRAAFRTSTADR